MIGLKCFTFSSYHILFSLRTFLQPLKEHHPKRYSSTQSHFYLSLCIKYRLLAYKDTSHHSLFLSERKPLNIRCLFKLAVPRKPKFKVRELACYTNTFPILQFSLARQLAGGSGGTQQVHQALTVYPSPPHPTPLCQQFRAYHSKNTHFHLDDFYASQITLLPTSLVLAFPNHTFFFLLLDVKIISYKNDAYMYISISSNLWAKFMQPHFPTLFCLHCLRNQLPSFFFLHCSHSIRV